MWKDLPDCPQTRDHPQHIEQMLQALSDHFNEANVILITYSNALKKRVTLNIFVYIHKH